MDDLLRSINLINNPKILTLEKINKLKGTIVVTPYPTYEVYKFIALIKCEVTNG